jgi:hypothetical protein
MSGDGTANVAHTHTHTHTHTHSHTHTRICAFAIDALQFIDIPPSTISV